MRAGSPAWAQALASECGARQVCVGGAGARLAPKRGNDLPHVVGALAAGADAQRSGVAQEAAGAAARSAVGQRVLGGLSADEARLILQVEPRATWEQVHKVRRLLWGWGGGGGVCAGRASAARRHAARLSRGQMRRQARLEQAASERHEGATGTAQCTNPGPGSTHGSPTCTRGARADEPA